MRALICICMNQPPSVCNSLQLLRQMRPGTGSSLIQVTLRYKYI